MRQQYKLIVRVNEDEQSIFRCIDLLKLLEEQVRSHQSSFNPEKIQFLIKFFPENYPYIIAIMVK